MDGKADQVAQTLRDKVGVKMVDVLEGPPNVIVMIQARDRQRLAELTNRALASVDNLTEGVQLLPTQNGYVMRMNEKDSRKLQLKRFEQQARSYGREG